MMQDEVDNLQVEMKRKDANIDLVHQDKDRLVGRIRAEEGELYFPPPQNISEVSRPLYKFSSEKEGINPMEALV